ncbi:MAG: DUF1460 domain-containing protein [Myxococcales bacterium]|nr:DUF1460 domain-containing protein [Myxococcales bacterium]
MSGLSPASLLLLRLFTADPCSREALSGLLATVRDVADTSERVARISEAFVGKPYRFSPLGEGFGVDPEPLCRLDRFDCLSLVEISLALALDSDAGSVAETLQRIRYLPPDGPPRAERAPPRWLPFLLPSLTSRLDRLRGQAERVGFVRRKHFPLSQWLPFNQRAGFIEDITEEVAGARVVWLEKSLDAELWKRRKRPRYAPRLQPGDVPVGTFKLPVLPIEEVLMASERIPHGAIVAVVRADRPDVFDPIVHMGIVVRKPDGVYLRHAVPKKIRRVIDEPLATFVKRSLSYRDWPVLGLNIQRAGRPLP